MQGLAWSGETSRNDPRAATGKSPPLTSCTYRIVPSAGAEDNVLTGGRKPIGVAVEATRRDTGGSGDRERPDNDGAQGETKIRRVPNHRDDDADDSGDHADDSSRAQSAELPLPRERHRHQHGECTAESYPGYNAHRRGAV